MHVLCAMKSSRNTNRSRIRNGAKRKTLFKLFCYSYSYLSLFATPPVPSLSRHTNGTYTLTAYIVTNTVKTESTQLGQKLLPDHHHHQLVSLFNGIGWILNITCSCKNMKRAFFNTLPAYIYRCRASIP